MQRFACIFILFSCFLLSFSAFAYISGKEAAEEKPIYCPASEIRCVKQANNPNDPGSCVLAGNESPMIWDDKNITGYIITGTYKFYGVKSPYQSHSDLVVQCIYSNPHGRQYMGVILSSKPIANIEAYYEKTAYWQWNPTTQLAQCVADSPAACPLKEQSAFLIYNKDIINGVVVSTQIDGKIIRNTVPFSKHASFSFDDILASCGSFKACTINLTSTYGYIYGSITVDMDNKLKILNINAAHPTEYRVSQMSPYNAVEISYNR